VLFLGTAESRGGTPNLYTSNGNRYEEVLGKGINNSITIKGNGILKVSGSGIRTG